MGVFQARILEWVAISNPGDLPHPGIKPEVPGPPAAPALQVDSLLAEPSGKPKEGGGKIGQEWNGGVCVCVCV